MRSPCGRSGLKPVPHSSPMLPTEVQFVYDHVPRDAAVKARAIVSPARLGRGPVAPRDDPGHYQVRVLLGRRHDGGFLAEVVTHFLSCSRFCHTNASSTATPLAVGHIRAVPRALAARLPEETASRSTHRAAGQHDSRYAAAADPNLRLTLSFRAPLLISPR